MIMRYDEQFSQAVQEAQDDKEDAPVEWISYWKPNVTINLVDDFTRYAYLPLFLICLTVFPSNVYILTFSSFSSFFFHSLLFSFLQIHWKCDSTYCCSLYPWFYVLCVFILLVGSFYTLYCAKEAAILETSAVRKKQLD